MSALQALRNPGMRPRHWDQLSSALSFDLHPDSSYTLDKALQQGLLAHLDTITKVADVASKEYSIEQVGRPASRRFLQQLLWSLQVALFMLVQDETAAVWVMMQVGPELVTYLLPAKHSSTLLIAGGTFLCVTWLVAGS